MLDKKTLSILINAKDEASRELRGVSKEIERATSASKNFAKGVAAVGVGFTALLSKYVMMGGIDRALNIEDAQAKLRGLGHDTKAMEEIMDSALESVLGTAYGLDDAATAAASAVAAGVKPGKELTRYLSIAADTATIAGVSFSEMGSIFGKVQTQQRAYTMEINQLADRGIPIYQWLQEELGVTQEALRDMVSDGEIDSKTYFKVIEENIGGAALESGKTTRGAWANMQAAMSRVGAAIVEDIIPRIRNAFGSMTEWFDYNADRISDIASQMLEGGLDRFVELFKWIRENFAKIGGAIGGALVPALASLAFTLGGALIALAPFVAAGWILGSMLEKWIEENGGVVASMEIVREKIENAKQWIDDNRGIIYGLVAAYATLKTAIMLHGAASAFTSAMKVIRTQATLTAGAKGIGGLAFALNSLPVAVTVGILVAGYHLAMKQIRGVDDAIRNMHNNVDRQVESAREKVRNASTDAERRLSARELYKKQNSPAASVGRNADGTNYWRGGPTWVGEEGPEIIDLPRGSKVYSNDDSKAMSSTTNIYGNIIVDSQQRMDQLMDRINNEQTLAANGIGS